MSSFIEEKKDLINFFELGCTSLKQRKIGTEQEVFVYKSLNLTRAPYLDNTQGNIMCLLERLKDFGWIELKENNHIVGVKKGKASITLEPGGQIELSGEPLKTIHETYNETISYHQIIRGIGKEIGLVFIPLGSESKFSRSNFCWMPKARYKIMRSYLSVKEKHGIDMMLSTTTAQVNLDYISEKDMVRKFQVALKLQPLITALFANSPFEFQGFTRHQSRRSFYWLHTDPDRCGFINKVFQKSFSFESYIDFALDVPMYFIYKKNKYLNAMGQSFRDFLKGELPACPGQLPTYEDWSNHLSTIFTEVRLKKFLEMRGADGGSQCHILALSALWVGLLYDDVSLSFCEDLTKDWMFEDILNLLLDCSRNGFNSSMKGQKIQHLLKLIIFQSQNGLKRRNYFNDYKEDESIYLNYLLEVLEIGTKSTVWKKSFQNKLNYNMDFLLRSISMTL